MWSAAQDRRREAGEPAGQACGLGFHWRRDGDALEFGVAARGAGVEVVSAPGAAVLAEAALALEGFAVVAAVEAHAACEGVRDGSGASFGPGHGVSVPRVAA